MIRATIHLLTAAVCFISMQSNNLAMIWQVALFLTGITNFICCIVEAEFS